MLIDVSDSLEEDHHHMDDIARFYVKCTLWLGVSDPGYVSTYFGPERLREEALTVEVPPESVAGYTGELLATLDTIEPLSDDARARHAGLRGLVRALEARARGNLDFEASFGIPAPGDDPGWFEGFHTALDGILPGSGDLASRYREFMAPFVVPPDRFFEVFVAAVAESRRRTAEHIMLPPGEEIEYLAPEGRGRYLGGGRSLIRVNIDRPVTIDQILPLACGEGYPGRHTIQAIRDAVLVRGRGWIEHTGVPVASPFATITEGAARFGVEMAFPGVDRTKFTEEILFPLAGLEPGDTALLEGVNTIATGLFYSGTARIAAGLAAGTLPREEACGILKDVLLLTPETAEACLRCIEGFGAYPAAVNEGYRRVRDYVGTSGSQQWERFARILTAPLVPADLADTP
ncbi:MAG: hypothetical protein GX216_02985 [Methanomicrobiales archaeon]|nr:hypothetical protein [Methanomicrobiales archaeon]